MPDGGVLYAEYHFDGPYRIRSDLHVRSPDGQGRRVTDGARLDHPSAAPDGRSAVAVRYGPGTSTLVEVDLATGSVRELPGLERGALWAFPRVSPDGRWIAASRWRPGAYFDVVLLDRTGAFVAEVTRDRALDVAPAWSPDGRWLVWGSDRSGVPNLLAVQVGPEGGIVGGDRQVTNVLTGAAFPSVDPSGRWVYASVYHTEGWELGRVRFDPATWGPAMPEDARFRAAEPYRPVPQVSPTAEGDYSALRSIRPRYWELDGSEARTAAGKEIIGPALGFTTEGEDVVARHGFGLGALLATSGELEGSFDYRYQGLGNPTLSVGASQLWGVDGPLAGERQSGAIDTLWLREREREVSASASYRHSGFRVSTTGTVAGGMVWERRELLDQRLEPSTVFRLTSPTARLFDYRATVSLSSARAYAFSMGAAEGASASVQARRRKHLALADSLSGEPGADRSFDEVIARLQVYESFPLGGFTNHVLALRGAFGAARGPAAGVSHFRVGGASGTREPVSGLALFGASSFLFPVRGYENGARRGRYALAGSAEYRFPLWLIDQGLGLFPLHFDRVGGSLFVDGGNAWGAVGAENPRRETLVSAGGELVTELLTFYNIGVTLRTGVAFPLVERDPARRTGLDPLFYVRFGRSF
jgi:hypothetical protein